MLPTILFSTLTEVPRTSVLTVLPVDRAQDAMEVLSVCRGRTVLHYLTCGSKWVRASLLSHGKFAFPAGVVVSLLGTEFWAAVSFCVGLHKQQFIKSAI